jgi:hypothetical protein
LIFASLYQDKEVKKKSKMNEENAFKDCVLEISGFHRTNLLMYPLLTTYI